MKINNSNNYNQPKNEIWFFQLGQNNVIKIFVFSQWFQTKTYTHAHTHTQMEKRVGIYEENVKANTTDVQTICLLDILYIEYTISTF